jgi:general secretion pathway protein C
MAVDKLLQRHFWAVIGALLAIAAFLDAQGILQVVDAALAADSAQLATPPFAALLPRAPLSAGLHATSADRILSRNAFDSVTGPIASTAGPDGWADEPEPDPSDPLIAPDCEDVRVVAIAAGADPEGSFAALQAQEGNESGSYLRRRGGQVGGMTVKFVGRDRVWMTRGPRLCQSVMFRPPPGTPSRVPTGGPPPVSDTIRSGIRRIGPGEFDIDRGVVDAILENQGELMRLAHVTPELDHGQVVGIRLSGVRSETLLGALGIEDGDRVEKMNGFELSSTEKILEAYARLRTAGRLTLSLTRRGHAVNIDYNIR